MRPILKKKTKTNKTKYLNLIQYFKLQTLYRNDIHYNVETVYNENSPHEYPQYCFMNFFSQQ